jgi:hypothetical protein
MRTISPQLLLIPLFLSWKRTVFKIQYSISPIYGMPLRYHSSYGTPVLVQALFQSAERRIYFVDGIVNLPQQLYFEALRKTFFL